MTDEQSRLEYCLYIDESGDHVFKRLEDPSHRFLGLLGVWFRQDEYSAFADSWKKFKRGIFGSEDVVLHREDIVNRARRKGPFSALN